MAPFILGGNHLLKWIATSLVAVNKGIDKIKTNQDVSFHSWCDQVRIETPLCRLETTSKSIAGRGLFTTDDVKEGDVLLRVPEELVLYERTGALYFPEIAQALEQCKQHNYYDNKLKNELFEFSRPSDFWQPDLVAYCLGALESEACHPWKEWIEQWQRNDPMHDMFEKGSDYLLEYPENESVMEACVQDFQKILPDVDKKKLKAAIDLRLRRYLELQKIFPFLSSHPEATKLFSLMISRAIDLGGNGLTGVIPMVDMINHSDGCRNVGLVFDESSSASGGAAFEVVAMQDIQKGSELFISYDDFGDNNDVNENNEWDEIGALWLLIQWGIPRPKPRVLEPAT